MSGLEYFPALPRDLVWGGELGWVLLSADGRTSRDELRRVMGMGRVVAVARPTPTVVKCFPSIVRVSDVGVHLGAAATLLSDPVQEGRAAAVGGRGRHGAGTNSLAGTFCILLAPPTRGA